MSAHGAAQPLDINGRRDLHARAVASYVASAERFDPERWHGPLQPGKWSAAEVTQHLRLSFEAVMKELQGGAAMQLRTSRWIRLIIRFTIMRPLLAGGAFPVGARSPREARPVQDLNEGRDAALSIMRDAAAAAEAMIVETHARRHRTQVTHPYFGSVGLSDMMLISARHIDHHRGQLERAFDAS